MTLAAGAAFAPTSAAPDPKTGYTQVRAAAVDLAGATLRVGLDFAAAVGQQFTVIDNTGDAPVVGRFAGLAEGATVASAGGALLRVSYAAAPATTSS